MTWHNLAENSAFVAVIQVFALIAICQEHFACGQIVQFVLKAVLVRQVNAVLAWGERVKLELH